MARRSVTLNSPRYALETFDPAQIRSRHPWLDARDLNVVLGDDLDSVMCGVLMHHLLAWKVVGFYTDYTRVWHPEGVGARALREAVWLDLDISREEIRSIGHHILLAQRGDNLACHQESVNPNLFRGVTGRPGSSPSRNHGEGCPCGGVTFPHKYPLGAIHFLLWLFNVSIGRLNPLRTGLLWLPDSSWINGQSHQYRPNVLDWTRNWIPNPALLATVDLIDTEDFERTMRDVVFATVEAAGFSRGRGQTTSRHLRLGGYQCQFSDPNRRHASIQALADLVASTFGWSRVTIPPPPYRSIEGIRNEDRHTLATVRRDYGSLDRFVRRRRVFSYVVPNSGKINYTTGIELGRAR
jgi:hypothetical protein